MRKLMFAAMLAVLSAAVLATSASAFDHHFYVHQKYRSGHTIGKMCLFRSTSSRTPTTARSGSVATAGSAAARIIRTGSSAGRSFT